MSAHAGSREALVRFPVAGDPELGLAGVRVIDWGQPALGARMTRAGPGANALGKDEEIEAAIRTERLYGGCRSAAPDGQLMVELLLADGQQISGRSYTLALVLAAQLARGCLPLLAGRCVIASGRVERDGAISPVGQMAEKLAAVGRALAEGAIAAPVLILARANLERLTSDEQGALRALTAGGLRYLSLTSLAELGPVWPPELLPVARPPPSPGRRSWGRPPVLPVAVAGAVALTLGLASVAVYLVQRTPATCAGLSSDPAVIARCWEPLPLTLQAACRVERQGGYRPWRPCPSGTCLAVADQFRLELTPGARGWLYVFHLDAVDQVLEDLGPGAAQQPVRPGEPLVLPSAGKTYHVDGRAAQEHFYALLTMRPINGLHVPGDAPRAALREFLDTVAERFMVCRDPLPPGPH